MNPLISPATTFEGTLLLTTPLLPVLMAIFFIIPAWRSKLLIIAPFTGLAGLLAALLVEPGATLDLPWNLLGTRLGMDATAQTFLLFTALLWLLAGFFSYGYMAQYEHQPDFTAFYLLSMGGNFGLILSQDIVSFYLFFALMSFASYALVIHNRDAFSIYAGRVYILLVIVGELMVFTAFIMISTQAGTIYLDGMSAWSSNSLSIGLLLLGFGIKAGALPLHFWLPLAHPAAPVPASAVLSGAMIKAGLIGWLRFLPLGSYSLPEWGMLVIMSGLAAAFYGAFIGIGQSNPKTVLAYSSISQMGLITIGVGIGLIEPNLWSVTLPAILLYALHHGLAKGALFLGVGISTARLSGKARKWSTTAMFLPALALAGAPLTSGILAKSALKATIPSLPNPWPGWLDSLLPLAAIGTTLLMARFLYLIWHQAPGKKPLQVSTLISWILLVICVAFIAWTTPAAAEYSDYSLKLSTIWLAVWPIGIGLLIAFISVYISVRRAGWRLINIPPGDVLVLLEWTSKKISLPPISHISMVGDQIITYLGGAAHTSKSTQIIFKIERRLADFTIIGVLLLLTALVIFGLSLVTP